ncbi:MAG: hypothetical protein ACR2G7_09040 [Acidimicrobiales bacterium]
MKEGAERQGDDPGPKADHDGHAASLQDRLSAAPGDEPTDGHGRASTDDLVGLFRAFEASGRFRRDTGLGRVYHPGKISLRENRRSNSLHIAIEGNRVSAHVDQVSPLALSSTEPAARYSLLRIGAHNLSGMAADLGRLLRGRQGDHRCELDCAWDVGPVAGDPDADRGRLLDPSGAPWSVQLEAAVTGTLDEGRMRAAVVEALGLEPSDPEVLDVVECPDGAALSATRSQFQRLAVPPAWPPLRVRLARRRDGDIVMLNLNHAATDGFGALRVLAAIARTYAGRPDHCCRPDFLALRDLPVRPASAPVSGVRQRYRSTVERIRDLLSPPAQLAPDQGGDQDGFGFHHVTLTSDSTGALSRTAVDGEDVLLAALHLAIAAWNAEHQEPAHRIGVLSTANLRPREWPLQSVANLSVTARISTSRRHRTSAATTVKAIQTQTERNQRSRTGTALITALRRSGLLVLWAKQSIVVVQPITGNWRVDTAMLCTLGRLPSPPSFGGEAGVTTDVWFSVPPRIPLGLSVGAVTVSGRLHLVVRYPYHLFSADAARRFADGFLDQLREATTDAIETH